MDRLTFKQDGGDYAVLPDKIQGGTDAITGEAIDRLAAYENMQEALEQQYAQATEKLEGFKAQGKLKTSTAQQLLAQKLTYSSMLGLIDLHGGDR